MYWLSKSAEELIKQCDAPQVCTVDVAVVGSGYGGAVAALRFAERGQTVYLLERGKEYVAGEFPNDVSQVGKHVRSEMASAGKVVAQGYEDALFDFRIGVRAGALVGNGLGGGSLINAGVGLAPDQEVFAQSSWPAALRRENMQPWFQKARDTLELQTPGKPAPGCTQPADPTKTAKYQRLKELHESRFWWGKHDTVFETAPIAVQLDSPVREQGLGSRQPCIGCGDCVTGCNYSAKLSLTATYLPRAVRAGAKPFTGVTVLFVEHDPNGNAKHPWVLHFLRTSERKLAGEIASNADRAPETDKNWTYILRAKTVVLGAGAFGSTEILLRSGARGLELSDRLGQGLSGNGDDIAVGYDLNAPTNSMGWGSKSGVQKVVGPTISGVVRTTDAKNLNGRSLLQDGAIPGLMDSVFHELVTTLAALNQLDKWHYRKPEGRDPLVLQPTALAHSLTLLRMGHDAAGGTMQLSTSDDRLRWEWPKSPVFSPGTTADAEKKAVEDLGGIYLRNPMAGLVPGGLRTAIRGQEEAGAMFTVHPLGGCRMGDSAATGVVNHCGAVWKADNTLHDGLYVLDGATLPSSLGVNPLLTITALAERACCHILRESPLQQEDRGHLTNPAPAGPTPLRISDEFRSGVELAEVLRGTLQVDSSALRNSPQKDASQKNIAKIALCSTALFLQFNVPDWQVFYGKNRHTVNVVPGRKKVSGKFINDGRYAASRLVVDLPAAHNTFVATELVATGGTIDLFCPKDARFFEAACRLYRTACTCWRWRKKGAQGAVQMLRRIIPLLYGLPTVLKLVWHASQAREFVYRVDLVDSDGEEFRLEGRKLIEAAASMQSLEACAALQRTGKKGWPAPERPSIWQQLTQLDLQLDRRNGEAWQRVASGSLTMDLPDMLRRVVPQLEPQGDTLRALLDLAGYPLLFLRALIQTRVLDIRPGDYENNLPDSDPALTGRPDDDFELQSRNGKPVYPVLQPSGRGEVRPEEPVKLLVQASWPRTQAEQKSSEKIRIGLVRYRQKPLVSKESDGMHRVRSIVLLNGFDLSTLPFVAEELGSGNLASKLHAAGWDVWMLEYRASPLLDASARRATMDDIAAFDIPAAVNYIIATVSKELGLQPKQTQIFAFGHCVGAAALAMALLAGYLRHPGGKDQIAGVLFSQYHLYTIGSVAAQLRLQLASFLSNVLKLETLQFTAGVVKPNALYTAMDLLFSTAHYSYPDQAVAPAHLHQIRGERCPGEDDLRVHSPDTTTCKRMTGLLSRLFNHSQLLPETHKKLDYYFGRSNLGVFMHGAKCVEYERLVNADGQNVYVTDKAIQQHLTMPVMLLHGADNVLFHPESMDRTHDQLERILGRGGPSGLNRKLLVNNHAHFDCTVGRNAPSMVFQPAVAFFNSAFHRTANKPVPSEPSVRSRARLPRTGPVMGWVRPSDDGKHTLIRVWMEFDDQYSDLPVAALTVVQCGSGPETAQAWPVYSKSLASEASYYNPQNPAGLPTPFPSAISYAVADIEVPSGCTEAITLQMLGIHSFNSPVSTAEDAPTDGFLTAWGVPITKTEIQQGLGDKTSAPPGEVFDTGQRPVWQRAPHSLYRHILTGHAPFNLAGNGALEAALATESLQPMDLGGATLNPAIYLEPNSADIEIKRNEVRLANPLSLSRQRRTLRTPSQRVLTLGPAQRDEQPDTPLAFVAAACRHPGLTAFERDRADQTYLRIDRRISERKIAPRFMLLLGDQIYADARAGLFDTQSPIESLLPRYRAAFGSSRGFRIMAQKLPLYMVMDDHEIWDGWSAEQSSAGANWPVLAKNARAAFEAFQFAHGPAAVLPPTENPPDDFSYSFHHKGYPFLVLDTRSARTRIPQRMINPTRWRWMEAWLTEEQEKGAHPKFIVSGSVLAPGLREDTGNPVPRSSDTWQMATADRQRLLSFIRDNTIQNVVFLSSDYHCSAAADISFSGTGIRAYAIVAPPLHAPLRFTSQIPAQILREELVPLQGGDAHIISSPADAQGTNGWEGEGWLECTVAKNCASWTLQLKYHLRPLETAEWNEETPTLWERLLT